MTNEFKGFSLFNDITDVALRNRNRAVVLANMADAHQRNRKINPKGFALILGYFQEIPEQERNDVKERFATTMKERGYVITSV